jgi:hypothetical protein
MTRVPWDGDIMCGSLSCLTTSVEFFGHTAGGPGQTMRLDGWWRRADLAGESARESLSDGRGIAYDVPDVFEDLIVRVVPQRAMRPGETNHLVHFPSVNALCERLITELGVVQARFDPHMTQQMRQALLDSTGADVDGIPFSNPEQYRRARLVKAMTCAHKVHLLPNAARDKEWKKLQRVGATNKIDHPSGGGKDIWDSESVAIWCAATYKCAQLSLTWT